ncbi:MAG: hypothetical protein J6U98_06870 [Abditibacteriota bacterium]|nr:hypothetical protein [Abditibacteriota bacterium]MBP5092664.1 hypothetical protein [Abditibacteriota bacterium]MBP5737538.1 hypothetical protein [Abditibacteriota bacterium]
MVRKQKVTAAVAAALTLTCAAAIMASSFISLSPKKISFKAKPGEVIEKRIKVKNKSREDRRLTVQPSCACVAANCPLGVKARQSVTFNVYIDTAGKTKGTRFSESITVVAGHDRIKVPITGKIR